MLSTVRKVLISPDRAVISESFEINCGTPEDGAFFPNCVLSVTALLGIAPTAEDDAAIVVRVTTPLFAENRSPF